MPKPLIAKLKAEHIYADPAALVNEGSRWQVVLREDAPDPADTIYFHVNHRGNGYFTIDINSDDGALDLVIQVEGHELASLTSMFASAASQSRYRK